MRIKISKGGLVSAVYNDKLRELNLGDMQVERASNVEFDVASQKWEARTPAGELIAEGFNRDEVIQQEVKVIESRL